MEKNEPNKATKSGGKGEANDAATQAGATGQAEAVQQASGGGDGGGASGVAAPAGLSGAVAPSGAASAGADAVATATANTDDSKADDRPVAIEVISRVDGFYRANRQWTIQPQIVPLAVLSSQQLQEIEREPLLIKRWVSSADR